MPTCDSCVLCNQPLVVLPKVASLRLAGMKGVAIKTAKVASKQCTNVDCKAVHNLVCHSPPLDTSCTSASSFPSSPTGF